MKGLHNLAVLLVVVGALNWGAVGLLGTNFVNVIVGSSPMIERLVYILVGLSGVWVAFDAWGKGMK